MTRPASKGRPRARRDVLAGALALLLASVSIDDASALPTRTGWLTDDAGVIDLASRQRTAARLENIERDTSDEVAIVVVRSLDTRPLDAYANELARAWGLGKAGSDNGVLLLIALDEKKARIETGKGIGDRLTDVECGHILEQSVVPRLRQGDVAAAVDAGAEAIEGRLRATARGAATAPPAPRERRSGHTLLAVFSLVLGLAGLVQLIDGSRGAAVVMLLVAAAIGVASGATWLLWVVGAGVSLALVAIAVVAYHAFAIEPPRDGAHPTPRGPLTARLAAIATAGASLLVATWFFAPAFAARMLLLEGLVALVWQILWVSTRCARRLAVVRRAERVVEAWLQMAEACRAERGSGWPFHGEAIIAATRAQISDERARVMGPLRLCWLPVVPLFLAEDGPRSVDLVAILTAAEARRRALEADDDLFFARWQRAGQGSLTEQQLEARLGEVGPCIAARLDVARKSWVLGPRSAQVDDLLALEALVDASKALLARPPGATPPERRLFELRKSDLEVSTRYPDTLLRIADALSRRSMGRPRGEHLQPDRPPATHALRLLDRARACLAAGDHVGAEVDLFWAEVACARHDLTPLERLGAEGWAGWPQRDRVAQASISLVAAVAAVAAAEGELPAARRLHPPTAAAWGAWLVALQSSHRIALAVEERAARHLPNNARCLPEWHQVEHDIEQGSLPAVACSWPGRWRRQVVSAWPAVVAGLAREVELLGRRAVDLERFAPGDAAAIRALVAEARERSEGIDRVTLVDDVTPLLERFIAASDLAARARSISTASGNAQRAPVAPPGRASEIETADAGGEAVGGDGAAGPVGSPAPSEPSSGGASSGTDVSWGASDDGGSGGGDFGGGGASGSWD